MNEMNEKHDRRRRRRRRRRRDDRRCLLAWWLCESYARLLAHVSQISMDAVSVPRVKRRITMSLHKNQNMHFLFTHDFVYAVLYAPCVPRPPPPSPSPSPPPSPSPSPSPPPSLSSLPPDNGVNSNKHRSTFSYTYDYYVLSQ